MISVYEGDKVDVAVRVTQERGGGAWALTTPQYRIVSSDRATVLVDWTAATWDGTSGVEELSATFNSTLAGLTAPGFYWVQLRGVIGAERYSAEVKVEVLDAGP